MNHFTAQIGPQKQAIRFFFFSFLILILAACGGKKGGGGGELEAPIADLSGTGKITASTISNDCGDKNGLRDQVILTVVQNGNNITFTDGQGNIILEGTISGNEISLTGSFPIDGGTTTVTSLLMTVSGDGKSSSGTASWTWIDDLEGCQGKSSVTVNFIPSDVSNPVRNIAGTWSILEIIVSNSCSSTINQQLKYSVDISQNRTAITVTGPNSTFVWKGIIIGSTVSWGGVTGASKNVTRKNMSLTLSEDGQSLEGTLDFVSTLVNDSTRICSGKNRMTGTKI